MPRALRVRDEIQRAYPDSLISMVPKPGGYFDVVVDGKTIFSKTEKIGTPIERFPEVGELVELLERRI